MAVVDAQRLEHARALVDAEARLAPAEPPAAAMAEPPPPIDVIVLPQPGSRLARAYKSLELEKLALVRELGYRHLACVIKDLQDSALPLFDVHDDVAKRAVHASAELAEIEQEQERLHCEWSAEIRAIINKKLGIE